MRLLAFSDLHRNADAARAIADASRQADVVVAAGDFSTMRQGLADTLDILRTIEVPTILVAGNHDHLQDLRDACNGWSRGHLLHGKGIQIGDVMFFGLGFEIATIDRGPWNSQINEVEAAVALAACPANAVLVTHAPPYGAADLQADGRHDGSRAIRTTIEQARPRLNLCGHVHYSWGARGIIEGCPVHNLGPRINWFDI